MPLKQRPASAPESPVPGCRSQGRHRLPAVSIQGLQPELDRGEHTPPPPKGPTCLGKPVPSFDTFLSQTQMPTSALGTGRGCRNSFVLRNPSEFPSRGSSRQLLRSADTRGPRTRRGGTAVVLPGAQGLSASGPQGPWLTAPRRRPSHTWHAALRQIQATVTARGFRRGQSLAHFSAFVTANESSGRVPGHW